MATNKFQLCVLRTQVGKTFTAINTIKTNIQKDGSSIHFVFTMNTLLNNYQFSTRLDAIEQEYGKGSVCIFASKVPTKQFIHVTNKEQCYSSICAPYNPAVPIRVVIMCSNTHRFNDVAEVIEKINRVGDRGIYAYYDELHAYITQKQLRPQIEMFNNMANVRGILALSATPEDLWQSDGFWSRIQLFDVDATASDYTGARCMDFICDDSIFPPDYKPPSKRDFGRLEEETINFATKILSDNPQILAPNARVFAPAHTTRSGHNRMRDLIFSVCPEAVVVLINGSEKSIKFGDTTIHVKPKGTDELYKIIDDLVQANNLQGRPIVFTGFICIGMGQTLCNESTGPFTSAILGQQDLPNPDLYQLFGRLTGRMLFWSSYKRTRVYTTTTMKNRILAMEECANRLSSDYSGQLATLDDYEAPMYSSEEGSSALENPRRIQKRTKSQPKQKDLSDYRCAFFATYQEARVWAKASLTKMIDNKPPQFRANTPMTPKDHLRDGHDLTPDVLRTTVRGLNAKNAIRLWPCYTTNLNEQFCLFWKASAFN